MATRKKPSAGKAFDSLLGKLVRVPKAEADSAAKQMKKQRQKKKK